MGGYIAAAERDAASDAHPAADVRDPAAGPQAMDVDAAPGASPAGASGGVAPAGSPEDADVAPGDAHGLPPELLHPPRGECDPAVKVGTVERAILLNTCLVIVLCLLESDAVNVVPAHAPVQLTSVQECAFTSHCTSAQEKVEKFLRVKRMQNREIKSELRQSRAYRNPSFLQKMVEHSDIKEFGSNFPAEVFDPDNLHEEVTSLFTAWQLNGAAQWSLARA